MLYLLSTPSLHFAAYPPEQIHITLSPIPDTLVVSWVSFELNPYLTVVHYGSSAAILEHTANGTFFSYPNDICGANSTRSVHTANFTVPQGTQIFYRVTSDGLAWSPVFNTTGILRNKTSQTFSIFGDLAVYNTANAAPALTNDTREGIHDYSEW